MEAKKRKRAPGAGRPKGDPKKVKYLSMTVNCSEVEYAAIQLIAYNLKYKSISALLRSAITKGIKSSIDGKFTYKKDLQHWEYWLKNWDSTDHFSENADLEKYSEMLKTKSNVDKKLPK